MPLKNPIPGNRVAVTFRMPPLDGVVELFLCGDFNDWHTAGAPLELKPDGSWETTLELEAGRSYRFRYYDNQGRWHNDPEADSYVPNDFGSEDSVVDLSGIAGEAPRRTGEAAPKRKSATRKAAAPKPKPRIVPRDSKQNKSGALKKPKR